MSLSVLSLYFVSHLLSLRFLFFRWLFLLILVSNVEAHKNPSLSKFLFNLNSEFECLVALALTSV